MTSRLRHNVDMLMGLAERLAVLAADCPAAFSIPYTRVMDLVHEAEKGQPRPMSQNDKILGLLRKGASVTNVDLIVHHKVRSPTKRISELIAAGHDILKKWKTCPVDGSEYIVYSLKVQSTESRQYA